MSQYIQTNNNFQDLNTLNQATTTKTYVTNVQSPVVQTSSTSYGASNFVQGAQGVSTTYGASSTVGGANLEQPAFSLANANAVCGVGAQMLGSNLATQGSSSAVNYEWSSSNQGVNATGFEQFGATAAAGGSVLGVQEAGLNSGAVFGATAGAAGFETQGVTTTTTANYGGAVSSGAVFGASAAGFETQGVTATATYGDVLNAGANLTATQGATYGSVLNAGADFATTGFEAQGATTTYAGAELNTGVAEIQEPKFTLNQPTVVSGAQTISTSVAPLATTVVNTNANTTTFNAATYMSNLKVDPSTVPRVYPALTTKNIGGTSTTSRPVQYLAPSTVQGESTSKTLPVSYQGTITTVGRNLPTITAPVKLTTANEQNLTESRAPIYEKISYNKNEIQVGSRQAQTLSEINKSSEVQGGVLAPISNNPIMLKPVTTTAVSRKPQYESVTLKYSNPTTGGKLAPKYMQPKMVRPSVTRMGGRQTTREVVRLAQKIINAPPLQAEYRPVQMKTAAPINVGGMSYSKSVDNIFQTSNNLAATVNTATVTAPVVNTQVVNTVNNAATLNAAATYTTTNAAATVGGVVPEVFEGNTVGLEATTTTIPASYNVQGMNFGNAAATTSVVNTGDLSTLYGANRVEQISSDAATYGGMTTTQNITYGGAAALGEAVTGSTRIVSAEEAATYGANLGGVNMGAVQGGMTTTTQSVTYGGAAATQGAALGGAGSTRILSAEEADAYVANLGGVNMGTQGGMSVQGGMTSTTQSVTYGGAAAAQGFGGAVTGSTRIVSADEAATYGANMGSVNMGAQGGMTTSQAVGNMFGGVTQSVTYGGAAQENVTGSTRIVSAEEAATYGVNNGF